MDYFKEIYPWLTPAAIGTIVYSVFRYLRTTHTNNTQERINDTDSKTQIEISRINSKKDIKLTKINAKRDIELAKLNSHYKPNLQNSEEAA
jgi:hypothetical protein